MTAKPVLEIAGRDSRVINSSNGSQPVSRTFFRLLVLLALSAYAVVWTTGYLHRLIEVLSVPLLLAAIIARPLPSGRIILQLGSVLALLQAISGRSGSTPGVVLLLQFAGLVMFLQILVADSLRAAHGVIVLSLMIILAVAAMNVNFVFPLVLIPYIMIFYLVLRQLTIIRHQSIATAPIRLSGNTPLGWQRIAVGTLVSIMIFGFLWLVMFYLIPRTTSFGIASEVSRRKLKGFSDTMLLGDPGLLEDNPAVIMRVRPLEGKTLNYSALRRMGNKLLRGATFAWYNAGKWQKGTKRRWYIDLRRSSGELALEREHRSIRDLHQIELVLENLDPPVIFKPDRAVSMRFTQPYIAYEEDLSFYFLYRPGTTRRYVASVLLDPLEPEDSSVNEIELNRETTPYLHTKGIPSRVQSLAEGMVNEKMTILERVEKVKTFLRDQYEYSLVQQDLGGNDPVEDFLFVSKEGSCEHYASAMVLLLRAMGVAARPVGGYTMGDWNDIGGFFTIRQGHAHAWVEVYFPKTGWVPFDPTPPTMVTGPESEVGRMLQTLWNAYEGYWFSYVYSFDNRSQGIGFRRMLEALSDAFVSLRNLILDPFLWLLVALAASIAYLGRKRFRRTQQYDSWIPDWYMDWSESLSVQRSEWETPAEYHKRLIELGVISPKQGECLTRLAELVDLNAFSNTSDRSAIPVAARSVIAELSGLATVDKSGK
ncbi:MAG: hypothetical protein CVV42_05220 [Candidatus Riflebacteria bacterium HGW-Riflebacteria-2]|jgi:transglutaminase-like putative cysteine protease|nr:MAG: hypothetical protein CVV42_05220 [Candidatus Riflebacteria bacterium HGW-Riflebacteria-2]